LDKYYRPSSDRIENDVLARFKSKGRETSSASMRSCVS
jgi:hypothetical protein